MQLLILETWKLCAIPLPDFPSADYSLVCRQYFTEDRIEEAFDLLHRLQEMNSVQFKYSLTQIQDDGTTTTY